MKNTTHTKEPWNIAQGNKINPSDCDRWYICVKGGRGMNEELAVTIPNLGTRSGDPTSKPWDEEANAQRIVDCVNACEGINPKAVQDLLEALAKLTACLSNGRELFEDSHPIQEAIHIAGLAICKAKEQ